ncbi:hypothetical protein BDQ94DRAFT_142304 [Aspergillus welwitschiae]|uniref:Uncharacterized protein n=1 Tax=Aspergillus welwitschiae TaxID=1341132 RepID=A0A3F3Q4T1_9EURO|nr:hypothetical protein BDQ94DRAFT_142304 [Aspergillus welwitschiae]RDH34219.1 hypothetical protein BDQ94DRAFT_142304 [Aspergillus welwitschiae]
MLTQTRCLASLLPPCSPVSPDVGEWAAITVIPILLEDCPGRTRFTGRSDHATTMGSSPVSTWLPTSHGVTSLSH